MGRKTAGRRTGAVPPYTAAVADTGGESKGTVLLALAANAAIAVAKLVAGLLSGSAAMLAETAHSVADTLNEGFLLTALHRSGRPADASHPFGYSKERYFWALIAAVGIFVAGGIFSVLEGVRAISGGEGSADYLVSYIVLGVAFVFEGASWVKAVRQVRAEAKQADRSLIRHLRASPDPTVKTVASEDSAALVGILLAAAGLFLHQVTGVAAWDGIASICVGLLLVVVAVLLGRDTKSLLIGESVDPRFSDEIRGAISEVDGVDRVVELQTMQLGPDDVLVAARVDFPDGGTGEDVERVAETVDRVLTERFPEVKHVFLDPTGSDEPAAESEEHHR